jgi:hypothetical protein
MAVAIPAKAVMVGWSDRGLCLKGLLNLQVNEFSDDLKSD